MNIFLQAFMILTLATSCVEAEVKPQSNVKLTLDVADTPEKMAWGLMGVTSLPENHGMLFIYEPPRHASIWMFNVNIDLSIAFIDEYNVIRELHNAQAFPAMLGTQHRIPDAYALSNISPNDPIVRFFVERSIHSKIPVRYVLEMNKEWFSTNNIQIGDMIDWKPGQTHATIWRSPSTSLVL